MFNKNVNNTHLVHFIHISLLITLIFRGLVNSKNLNCTIFGRKCDSERLPISKIANLGKSKKKGLKEDLENMQFFVCMTNLCPAVVGLDCYQAQS